MFTARSARATGARWRRKITAATLTVALSTAVITLTAPTRALAEDANITCTPTQNVFAIKPTGQLMLYKFNDLSSTTTPAFTGNPAQIATGFNTFSKLLAGPDGWIYGIRPAENGSGMFAYHWNGTAFDVFAKPIGGTLFNIYAVQSRVNKITIDARGDFYYLQDDGTLRRSKYNAADGTFTHQPVASGWGVYNAITAVGDGVIYARTPAGVLHRYHFEPTSDRYISHRVIGETSWDTFGSFFTVGGDTILGIRAGKTLLHYRYRIDPVPAGWVFEANDQGGGWDGFIDVAGTSNACKLTKSFVPATPPAPTENNSPVTVLQSSNGSLEYGYTDNIGRAKWGRQTDPTDFGGTAWTPLPDTSAYVGAPALVQGADGKLDITVRAANSRALGFIPTTPNAPLVTVDRAGLMATGVAARKSPVTNKMVLFSVDDAGGLWTKVEGVDGFLAWQKRSSTPVLTGTPVVGPGPNNTLTVIGKDADGTFWAAAWNGTTLSAFSSLGGSGFTGKPAIVRYPGDLLRVFARDADGRIATQKQSAAGTAFPGTWEQIGDAGQTWQGSPGAIISPDTGLVEVLVRGSDGNNYFAQEVAQGSGTWPQFKKIVTKFTEQYAPDPTPFVYTDSGDPKWAFATYNQDFQVRVITASTVTSSTPAKSAGVSKGAATTAEADPAFTVNPLP
ncbi:hypothetical protein E1263_19445 [Kribbella antibiotica]|uniref:Uncharacterized protein n=1 Tax=Kribbella antibiotica TaxID=190195 RepID=A0A4R4ZKQ7_9ACTN|nr:tachylectin-related carbohydrate-binding protein [Kribbella antibiotica]TDD58394.1 hypothetical protein E1263_19445 [Kribbella antibiotica]